MIYVLELIHFHCSVLFYYITTPNLFIHLTVYEDLNFSIFFPITHNIAVNIWVPISQYTCSKVFQERTLGSRMAGSYGMVTFNFPRSCKLFFKSGCTNAFSSAADESSHNSTHISLAKFDTIGLPSFCPFDGISLQY